MDVTGEFICEDPVHFSVTADMLDSYRELGYFLVRNLLSPEEITKIKTAVEHERYLQHAFWADNPETGIRECRKVMWRHPGSDVTGMLTRCEKIAGTCEQVLGGEVYHYHTKLMTKAARTGGKHVWHQDYGYWYQNGCLFPDLMSVFIPVDPCRKQNGCLEILAGSHRCGRINHCHKDGYTGADLARVDQIRTTCPHRLVELDPGDALFFHCNLLHTSGTNVSETKRWALIPCYNLRANDPIYEHHHPQYTPLHKVPNTAILECTNFDDLSEKGFNISGEDKTAT